MRRWLGWFALAVIVGMQAGTVFKPFGTVGATRVADWVDLLTPYAVLGSAAMVLVRAGADRAQWTILGIGGITFTLGHGLHLSANSISNTAANGRPIPGDSTDVLGVIHLWDEVVSHYLWYSGLFLVLAALGLALRKRDLRVGPVDYVVGSIFGLTLFNNYVEGGTPYLGMLFAGAGVIAGLRWRPAPISRLLLLVAGIVLVLLVCWGLFWFLADGRVFPQFSELGWI